MLPKFADCTAGTGVEVAKGAETGGGFTWGERPLINLPLPLHLLFFGALIAEDHTFRKLANLQIYLEADSLPGGQKD